MIIISPFITSSVNGGGSWTWGGAWGCIISGGAPTCGTRNCCAPVYTGCWYFWYDIIKLIWPSAPSPLKTVNYLKWINTWGWADLFPTKRVPIVNCFALYYTLGNAYEIPCNALVGFEAFLVENFKWKWIDTTRQCRVEGLAPFGFFCTVVRGFCFEYSVADLFLRCF